MQLRLKEKYKDNFFLLSVWKSIIGDFQINILSFNFHQKVFKYLIESSLDKETEMLAGGLIIISDMSWEAWEIFFLYFSFKSFYLFHSHWPAIKRTVFLNGLNVAISNLSHFQFDFKLVFLIISKKPSVIHFNACK